MLVQVHSPTGKIELVRPCVAGVAVPGIPVPVPVVVAPFLVVRAIRRRSQPAVVVESRGRQTVFGHPVRIAGLEAESAGHEYLSDAAIVQELDGLDDIVGGAVIHPDLNSDVVLARRLDHLPAFPDIVGDRLFNVNMFAGLARPDGCQCMPVVGHDDRYGIDFLVVQDLLEVPFG